MPELKVLTHEPPEVVAGSRGQRGLTQVLKVPVRVRVASEQRQVVDPQLRAVLVAFQAARQHVERLAQAFFPGSANHNQHSFLLDLRPYQYSFYWIYYYTSILHWICDHTSTLFTGSTTIPALFLLDLRPYQHSSLDLRSYQHSFYWIYNHTSTLFTGIYYHTSTLFTGSATILAFFTGSTTIPALFLLDIRPYQYSFYWIYYHTSTLFTGSVTILAFFTGSTTIPALFLLDLRPYQHSFYWICDHTSILHWICDHTSTLFTGSATIPALFSESFIITSTPNWICHHCKHSSPDLPSYQCTSLDLW